MKTIIYYFTGTGNSLNAAKILQKNIADCELRPMAGLLFAGNKISAEKGTNIGFVYPIYFSGLPNIVVRFFDLINLENAGYVFSVATCGLSIQGSPVKPVSVLCEKAGHILNGSWYVVMPDNYIPMLDAIPEDKQKIIFDAAEKKLVSIVDSIVSRKNTFDKHTIPGKFMYYGGWYKHFMKKLPSFDNTFTVSQKCNSCLTCINICPVNNISVDDENKPRWKHHCESCLACLQFCPQEAISCGGKTESRRRYHNPSVTVSDMIQQKKSESQN